MKPNIVTMVGELAEISSGARRISERIFAATAASVETQADKVAVVSIANLRDQIALLDQRLRELSEALEDANDVVMTDEQLARFKMDFKARIKDTPSVQMIAAYDLSYFRNLQKSLRPPVASILLDIFDSRNMLPPDLWQRLSLSDGAL